MKHLGLSLIIIISFNMINLVTAQDTQCANRLEPNFYIGQEIELNGERTPNRIRSEPSLEAEFVENLQAQEIVIITDGPICVDGYFWWQIQRDSATSPIGWTVEVAMTHRYRRW